MLTTPLLLAEEAGEQPNPLLPAPYDLIWSTVIFVVLLLIFWKVVLPRMQALLDERSAAIEGGIKKAEAAQAEAAAALESYNTQLAEARVEAGRIKDQRLKVIDLTALGPLVWGETLLVFNQNNTTHTNVTIDLNRDGILDFELAIHDRALTAESYTAGDFLLA